MPWSTKFHTVEAIAEMRRASGRRDYAVNSKKRIARKKERRAERRASDPEYVLHCKKKRREQYLKHKVKDNARTVKWRKDKVSKDPAFKLQELTRLRIISALTRSRASIRPIEALGCSPSFLKQLLETQFKPGWNWKNHGKLWEVDHIRPLASFDFSGPDAKEQLKLCFHWMNVRPLEKTLNRAKGAKWEGK